MIPNFIDWTRTRELLLTDMRNISKEHLRKVKMQTTEWERIFTNRIANKGLVPRIYKELLKSNNNRTSNTI